MQLNDSRISPARIVVGQKGRIEVVMLGSQKDAKQSWSAAIATSGSHLDLTREAMRFVKDDEARATLTGLAPGHYDIWLERRSPNGEDWTRVGKAVEAVLDAEHPSVSVELRPPL